MVLSGETGSRIELLEGLLTLMTWTYHHKPVRNIQISDSEEETTSKHLIVNMEGD